MSVFMSIYLLSIAFLLIWYAKPHKEALGLFSFKLTKRDKIALFAFRVFSHLTPIVNTIFALFILRANILEFFFQAKKSFRQAKLIKSIIKCFSK